MGLETIVEECVTFNSGPLTLSGVLGYPASGTPCRAVLLCSPHPHFAGDMQNNVIMALARRLSEEAVTLRFDYRGVGESEIELPSGVSTFDYWDTIEQEKDYSTVLAEVKSAAAELVRAAGELPLTVGGYSFGAAVALMHGLSDARIERMVGLAPPLTRIDFSFLAGCAKPCLLLIGKGDFLYSEEQIDKLTTVRGPGAAPGAGVGVQLHVQESADHFFRGEEERVCNIVDAFVHGHLTPCREGKHK